MQMAKQKKTTIIFQQKAVGKTKSNTIYNKEY